MRAAFGFFAILGAAFMVTACQPIPDKLYNSIKCHNANACTDAELDNAVRQFTTTAIQPFGAKSTPDIMDKGTAGCGEKMNSPRVVHNRLYLPYCRAFLEYRSDAGDDAGKKFQNAQLAAIEHTIKNTKKSLMIVVYVHGWHHNADIETAIINRDATANVYKFHHMLARHAYQMGHLASLDRTAEPHETLGIYVGWRGESIRNEILSYLTVSGRAAAALRVGEGELGDDLAKIAQWMRKADETKPGNSRPSRMLVYGHSFGGRAVIKALAPRLARQSDLSMPVLGPGTLVATINPAIGSDALDPLFAPGKTAEKLSPKPHWINIASHDDIATWVHPAISWLGLIGVADPASPRRYYAVGHGPSTLDSAKDRFGEHALTHIDLRQEYISSSDRTRAIISEKTIVPPARRLRLEEKIRTSDLSKDVKAANLHALEEFEKGKQADFALPCRLMKDAITISDLGLSDNFPPSANDRCVSEWTRTFVLDGSQSVPLIQHFLDLNGDRFTESPESAHFYRLSATRLPRPAYPAKGYMWTLRTNKSMIDFSEDDMNHQTGEKAPSPGSLGVHNGYVETTITRMMIELLFDDVIPRQVSREAGPR